MFFGLNCGFATMLLPYETICHDGFKAARDLIVQWEVCTVGARR